MELLNILAAVAAILFPLVFLVFMNLSAKKGMMYSLIIVAILSFFIWQMDVLTIISAMVSGVIKSLSIVYILIGAMFLLNILRSRGMIDTMIKGFQVLTTDKRIQLIIVGFYFVALLEGAAGFGAPAAIVGPLLVLLGFSPLASVVLALIANAVPMTFGAVGTPLVDGIGTPLQLIMNDATSASEWVDRVSVTTAFVDLFLGSFIPVLLVLLYTTLFREPHQRGRRYQLEILPFAFVSGLIYTGIAYLSALFIGPEFGTLIGSLLGLVIVIVLVRYRILLPKVKNSNESRVTITGKALIQAWFPYVLVVLLLILTRTVPWLTQILNLGTLGWRNIFGTPISASFDFLYSPGFILLVVAGIVTLLYRVDGKAIRSSFQETNRAVMKTTLALVPSLAMVYIFLNSDINTAGQLSMPDYLSNKLSVIFGRNWIFVAPFLGNLGTFISGSTTTSNIMFTGVQYRMATINAISPLIYLTAQVLGANTGCMISVSKVVSACSVVDLTGDEGKVMRITIVVALIYSMLIGIAVNLLVSI